MDRLGSLRSCISHDSELNLVTLPVPSPEQGVGLERPEAVTRACQCPLPGTRSEDNTLASGGICLGGPMAPLCFWLVF